MENIKEILEIQNLVHMKEKKKKGESKRNNKRI